MRTNETQTAFLLRAYAMCRARKFDEDKTQDVLTFAWLYWCGSEQSIRQSIQNGLRAVQQGRSMGSPGYRHNVYSDSCRCGQWVADFEHAEFERSLADDPDCNCPHCGTSPRLPATDGSAYVDATDAKRSRSACDVVDGFPSREAYRVREYDIEPQELQALSSN